MDPINMFRTQSFIDPALMDPPRAEKTFLQLYGEKVVAKGIKSFKKGMATDSTDTEEGQPKNITENNQDSDKKE